LQKLFWLTMFACCTALLALVAEPAQARTLAEIRASGTLQVGLTGDDAPYDTRDTAGRYSGTDVDVAEALSGALGVSLTIVPTTWSTLSSDFKANRFDIAMGGISVTPERAALGVFSRPVVQDGRRPLVRCIDKDRFISVDAINRPDVAIDVNGGGGNEAFAKAHFPQAALRTFTDSAAMFADVATGGADVIVADGAQVDFQARQHPGVLCPAAVPQPFDHFEKAYLMTEDPPLKEAVDSVIARLVEADDPVSPGSGQWKDTPTARLEALALLQSLNAELLSHDSATLVLEHWCDSHHLASPAQVVAQRDPALNKAPTAAQLQRLGVADAKQVRYRGVKLLCGTRVLSEADNWYVPERLTPEMNQALDRTNIAFGKAVALLHFQRHTLSADLLWHPLPEGWENAGAIDGGTGAGALEIPDHVLQHHALLTRADGAPFSEVAETYTAAVLDFTPPDAR